MSYRGFLAELLLAEYDDRARRRSERGIKAAAFPRDKSLRLSAVHVVLATIWAGWNVADATATSCCGGWISLWHGRGPVVGVGEGRDVRGLGDA